VVNVERLRRSYVEGKSVQDICMSEGISRAAFYYHKNKEKAAGIDWDELRLANINDPVYEEQNEKRFLATLIKAFEKELETLDAEPKEVDEKLEILTKYANTYYRLKSPKSKDCKMARIEAARDVLYDLGKLALEKEEPSVSEFLSANADLIINSILRKNAN